MFRVAILQYPIFWEDKAKNLALTVRRIRRLKGKADVALTLGRGRFKVYALAADGTRRFRVPCTVTDGELRFTADIAADPTLATCQYEIIRGGGIKVVAR